MKSTTLSARIVKLYFGGRHEDGVQPFRQYMERLSLCPKQKILTGQIGGTTWTGAVQFYAHWLRNGNPNTPSIRFVLDVAAADSKSGLTLGRSAAPLHEIWFHLTKDELFELTVNSTEPVEVLGKKAEAENTHVRKPSLKKQIRQLVDAFDVNVRRFTESLKIGGFTAALSNYIDENKLFLAQLDAIDSRLREYPKAEIDQSPLFISFFGGYSQATQNMALNSWPKPGNDVIGFYRYLLNLDTQIVTELAAFECRKAALSRKAQLEDSAEIVRYAANSGKEIKFTLGGKPTTADQVKLTESGKAVTIDVKPLEDHGFNEAWRYVRHADWRKRRIRNRPTTSCYIILSEGKTSVFEFQDRHIAKEEAIRIKKTTGADSQVLFVSAHYQNDGFKEREYCQ